MKKILILLFIFAAFNLSAQNFIIKSINRFEQLQKDSIIKIRPSYGVDMFTREGGSGDYKFGVIPGIGYGISFKPRMMKDNYLCALDLYVQGFATNEVETHPGLDYFNVDFLPVFSVFNWFGIGYGLRQKIGLEGVKTEYKSIFTFGIRKEF
jgi:hypothetical protein